LRQQSLAMHNRNIVACGTGIYWRCCASSSGLYFSTLARLFLRWMHDPNFQHGIFVPLFALFVLWHDRRKLAAIPSSPSWVGLPLVFLSLLVMVLGVLGADILLPRVLFLILLAGLIILFQGWTFFRAILLHGRFWF
jgi:hypothetical protein